jgi:hypothetical protein
VSFAYIGKDKRKENMYKLTRLMGAIMYYLLLCFFISTSYAELLPHRASHSGKTHFPINICSTTHYPFRFTPLGYDGVKPNTPSSLSTSEFDRKVHKNYLYPGQSDVRQNQLQSMFEGILRFAQVASRKGSKSGSNAVRMDV